MIMTSWFQMLIAMLAATALYDLAKIGYKRWEHDKIMRKVYPKGKPIGYVEVKEDGTLLEHIFDINYKYKDRSN